MTTAPQNDPYLRKLDGGLILRFATPGDLQALCDFNARLHTEPGSKSPNQRVGVWTRDMLHNWPANEPPVFFTVVEEEQSGRIVSSMATIPQTWTYAGVPIKVGRPEIVGTLPEFRHRGLTRAQFECAHQLDASQGVHLQAITGIPYFYRQFGYEMAVELDAMRSGYEANLPDQEKEPVEFSIQPAEPTDLHFITDLYARSAQRYLLHCLRDRPLWLYELNGKSEDSATRFQIDIIQTAHKQPVGFLIYLPYIEQEHILVKYLEVGDSFNQAQMAPVLMRHLWDTGQRLAKAAGTQCKRYSLALGSQHPFYAAAADHLPIQRARYTWYVRVPQLDGFLKHVAPVLNQRLKQSQWCDYNGTLKITFYRSELHLVFSHGCLQEAKILKTGDWEAAEANFPDLTFLQLVFGYRSSLELREIFPDCMLSDKTAALLNTLFPKQLSLILPLD